MNVWLPTSIDVRKQLKEGLKVVVMNTVPATLPKGALRAHLTLYNPSILPKDWEFPAEKQGVTLHSLSGGRLGGADAG